MSLQDILLSKKKKKVSMTCILQNIPRAGVNTFQLSGTGGRFIMVQSLILWCVHVLTLHYDTVYDTVVCACSYPPLWYSLWYCGVCMFLSSIM